MRTRIDDIFEKIEKCPEQAYFGRGVHTLGLIKWILAQIGPADMWISSYSTSEEFLRGFLLMRNKSRILHSTMLADIKASKKTVKLWKLMSSCFDDVFVGENHSKVVLFKGKGNTVSIVTSQNQTYGSRDESTIVTTSKKVFNDLLQGFVAQCDNHSFLINALQSGTIEAYRGSCGSINDDIGGVRPFGY